MKFLMVRIPRRAFANDRILSFAPLPRGYPELGLIPSAAKRRARPNALTIRGKAAEA
jgi:hypothetical protein